MQVRDTGKQHRITSSGMTRYNRSAHDKSEPKKEYIVYEKTLPKGTKHRSPSPTRLAHRSSPDRQRASANKHSSPVRTQQVVYEERNGEVTIPRPARVQSAPKAARPSSGTERRKEMNSRNLHVWGQWRTELNENIISDFLNTADRKKQVVSLETKIKDGAGKASLDNSTDPTRALLNYSLSPNRVTDLDLNVFLRYGIPRAKVNRANAGYRALWKDSQLSDAAEGAEEEQAVRVNGFHTEDKRHVNGKGSDITASSQLHSNGFDAAPPTGAKPGETNTESESKTRAAETAKPKSFVDEIQSRSKEMAKRRPHGEMPGRDGESDRRQRAERSPRESRTSSHTGYHRKHSEHPTRHRDQAPATRKAPDHNTHSSYSHDNDYISGYEKPVSSAKKPHKESHTKERSYRNIFYGNENGGRLPRDTKQDSAMTSQSTHDDVTSPNLPPPGVVPPAPPPPPLPGVAANAAPIALPPPPTME